MTIEQKPRRYDYNNRRDYRMDLGKWRRNWMNKAWRKQHLAPKDNAQSGYGELAFK
jgi:hypothetical protein